MWSRPSSWMWAPIILSDFCYSRNCRVSISDLVQSLGSTKGWVSFSSFLGCLFQLLFLSLSFCLCICILSLLRQKTQTAQWYFSVGDIPLCCISQGTPPFVSPSPPQELVVSRRGLGNHLCFFCPGHFRAGNIHNKLSFWHEKLPCFEVIRVEFTLTASSTHSGGISKDMRNT